MRKRYELTNPDSCMSRAMDEEMTFGLLARDEAAPIAIEAWIDARIYLDKNQPGDPQIMEAAGCVHIMRRERVTGPEPREEPAGATAAKIETLLAACRLWDEGLVHGEEYSHQEFLAWVSRNRRAAREAIAKVTGGGQ